MARTNIDIDEWACAVVMRRYGLGTKREAVNFALRELAAELGREEARRLRGVGWDGDLEQMRANRRLHHADSDFEAMARHTELTVHHPA